MNDFFLVSCRDEFIENARLFIFETYCRIHQVIDISMLAEKLNMVRSVLVCVLVRACACVCVCVRALTIILQDLNEAILWSLVFNFCAFVRVICCIAHQ